MFTSLKHNKKLYSGLLFTVLGVAAAVKSTDYDIGTATNMGPGYFPEALGILLAVFGIGIVLQSLLNPAALAPSIPRKLTPLLLIILGVFGFAFTVDRFGLVFAIVVLLGFACLRHVFVRPIEVSVTIAALVIFSVGLFVYGFQMPFNIF